MRGSVEIEHERCADGFENQGPTRFPLARRAGLHLRGWPLGLSKPVLRTRNEHPRIGMLRERPSRKELQARVGALVRDVNELDVALMALERDR